METVQQLLRMTRRIVEDGGDPEPCVFGTYCLRCCAAIAKGDLTRQGGLRFDELDDALEMAISQIATRDKGISHTRETALALLDDLI